MHAGLESGAGVVRGSVWGTYSEGLECGDGGVHVDGDVDDDDGAVAASVVASLVWVVVWFGRGWSGEEDSLVWELELVGRDLVGRSRIAGQARKRQGRWKAALARPGGGFGPWIHESEAAVSARHTFSSYGRTLSAPKIFAKVSASFVTTLPL